MSGTRDFSGNIILQRRQNQNYARNLYLHNTTGQRILNNPQNSQSDSSRFNTYIPGAQTEYFRGLRDGPKTVSIGGIVNIPPFPTVIPSNSISNTVPSAPTITSIIPNNQELSVIFTIPSSDGGSPITNYQYSTNNGSTFSNAGTTSSPIVITGLTNSTTYNVIIRAVNVLGFGASSNMVQATPSITVPSAPIITSINVANQTLVINFTQANDGGSPITDYQYSLTGGTLPFTSGATTTSPIIISGLNNNQPYSVAIFAVNSLGPSPLSNVVTATPIVTVNTFTAVGSTTWTTPTGISSVEYLVVGGGGGSGATHDGGSAGGGGGGMVLTGTLSVISGNTYSVVVGDGGAGGISYSSANPGPGGIRETDGISGENSEFASIVALGGGYGNKSRTNGTGTGGQAVSDPSTASTGGFGGSFNNGGGGGGGDSGAGSNGVLGVPRTGGAGGVGTASSISGGSVTYGVGGRGGRAQAVDNAEAGANNTGNGAKGPGTGFGSQINGAKGGSGIVILRY